VTQNILTPLLQTIGERWEHKQLTVAEEHFFSVYLRNKLGARFHHRRRTTRGPLLLMACLPREDHELGLLFLALAAHQSGYRVILLGANLPLEEIPGAARETGCDAVVLSATTRPASKLLEETLGQVVDEIDVPVFVGGKSAAKYADAINNAGALAVGSDINEGLAIISQRI
jgi:methanogenic corrinoid protein MtbC1